MKTDTQLLNEIAHKTDILRQLTKEESVELKKKLLGIHNSIVKVCDKYGLRIMLSGGSCLGTIRHKGFIPWDDDLDMIMPREDYEKLISLYEEGKVDSNLLFEYPNKRKDVKNNYLKVFLKGTLLKEMFDDSDSFPSNIFVDIFPMDFAPENKLLRKIKGLLSDGLQFVCTCVLYKKYPSHNLKIFYQQDTEAYERYKFRLFIGSVCSFLSHRKWVYLFDGFNKNSRPSHFYTIPCGRKHYIGETLPSDTFFPPIESTFEGMKTYLPHIPHDYLSNLYGDYMKIPPEDKRERHFIIDIKFGQKNEEQNI